MANFDISYKRTNGHEGGYTVDNGGETYRGVSFNTWGKHPVYKRIFEIIAKYKPLKQGAIIKDAELEKLLYVFYKNEYFNKQARGEEIKDQLLADFVYDFCVNSGGAELQINKAINKEFAAKVPLTNSITAETLKYLNAFPARSYKAIRLQRIAYLKTLPAWADYGEGWMNRIAKYPMELLEYVTNDPKEVKKK